MPTTFWGWVSLLIEKYGPLFLNGTLYTMLIAISGTVIGFVIGLLVAIVRTIPVSPKDPVAKKAGLKLAKAAPAESAYTALIRAQKRQRGGDDRESSGSGKVNSPGRRAVPGSTAFVPSVAGLIIASEVIKDLIHFEGSKRTYHL